MNKSKLAKAVELSFNEEMEQLDKELERYRVKILRERSGMSQSQFAEYFKIPIYTLQKWEQGQRKCNDYLIELIEYKLKNEKLI